MLLKREITTPRRSILRELTYWGLAWSLIASLFLVVIAVVGSIDFGHEDESSKTDVAKLTVSKFAFEAYPQWSRAHQGRCPASLDELTEYMDTTRTLDPWGQRYLMFCTGGRLIVLSSGEDRIPFTADDLWSNQ